MSAILTANAVNLVLGLTELAILAWSSHADFDVQIASPSSPVGRLLSIRKRIKEGDVTEEQAASMINALILDMKMRRKRVLDELDDLLGVNDDD